jgi:uncharacterized protein (TIGR02217 family)
MAFHEVRFPANLSLGSVGGPERRTEIVTLANGFEERNTPWSQSRRRYDAGLGMRSLDDLENLIAFFEARLGQMHGFRWKDWTDHKSCPASRAVSAMDQPIGVGDGATRAFPLVKTYRSGAQTYLRPVVKPVAGTVKIAVQGTQLSENTQFSVDHVTGIVTLNEAPEAGDQITAGFEFDVPVRFDTDRLSLSMASFQAGDVPSVPVVEVRT